MRCTALTALFFALFALFSTMAYAAPVAPQGAILNRQCEGSACRAATPPAASASPDRIAALTSIISNLLALMGGNTPSNDPQTSTTVTAAQSTSAAPASDPTGV